MRYGRNLDLTDSLLDRYVKALMTRLLDFLSGKNRFYTFNQRFIDDFTKLFQNSPHLEFKTAIILQGPISRKKKFTLKIVEFYLLNYQDLEVILSTWEDQDTSDFIDLSTTGRLHFVKSEYPEFPGISNINLQITSTQAGLEFAKTLGVKRVIKSRTDQGLVGAFALSSIEKYFEYFRTQDFDPIVALDRNSFLYRLYGISDMFQYSTTDTLILFWNVPIDSRNFEDVFNSSPKDIFDYAVRNTGETYLVTKYLSRLGESIDFTFLQHLLLLQKYFIILDSFPLGYVWNKYTKDERPWSKPEHLPHFKEISFIDWFTLGNDATRLETEFRTLAKSYDLR